MRVHKTSIPGLLKFELKVIPDDRGSFCELMNLKEMRKLGLPTDFQPPQTNLSKSHYGVIRGIHLEPWHKLIVPIHGRIFAAILDARVDSPTYGQVEIFEELDENWALFIPVGCGNSFVALDEPVFYLYNVNDYWDKNTQYPAVHPEDPFLDIPWPFPKNKRNISPKDRSNPPFPPRL